MRRPFTFAVALAVIAALGAASAQATPIIINPGAALAANPAALAAFDRAANQWGSLFKDPITVNINANLASLGAGILGSTSSVFLAGGFNLVRDQMVADAALDPNDAIDAYLPTAGQFSAWMPSGDTLSGAMQATKANMKAMGFEGLDVAFGAKDAEITFSTNFSFDYDNSDGVGVGLYDFETVAAHEIGHVLGFVSAVDYVDFLLCGNQTGAVNVEPLDLFRFGTADIPTTTGQFTNNPRSLLPNDAASFADTTNTWRMSTGYCTGDGRQASHWRDDFLGGVYIGLMDPTLASATIEAITYADLRALDLIGWDLQPVPEPASLLLLGTGLIGAVRAVRKRRG